MVTNQKLNSLSSAIDFLDRCKADREAGETGATRDAWEWVEGAAREVVAEHLATEERCEDERFFEGGY